MKHCLAGILIASLICAACTTAQNKYPDYRAPAKTMCVCFAPVEDIHPKSVPYRNIMVQSMTKKLQELKNPNIRICDAHDSRCTMRIDYYHVPLEKQSRRTGDLKVKHYDVYQYSWGEYRKENQSKSYTISGGQTDYVHYMVVLRDPVTNRYIISFLCRGYSVILSRGGGDSFAQWSRTLGQAIAVALTGGKLKREDITGELAVKDATIIAAGNRFVVNCRHDSKYARNGKEAEEYAQATALFYLYHEVARPLAFLMSLTCANNNYTELDINNYIYPEYLMNMCTIRTVSRCGNRCYTVSAELDMNTVLSSITRYANLDPVKAAGVRKYGTAMFNLMAPLYNGNNWERAWKMRTYPYSKQYPVKNFSADYRYRDIASLANKYRGILMGSR